MGIKISCSRNGCEDVYMCRRIDAAFPVLFLRKAKGAFDNNANLILFSSSSLCTSPTRRLVYAHDMDANNIPSFFVNAFEQQQQSPSSDRHAAL
jgi:hypothetical protein